MSESKAPVRTFLAETLKRFPAAVVVDPLPVAVQIALERNEGSFLDVLGVYKANAYDGALEMLVSHTNLITFEGQVEAVLEGISDVVDTTPAEAPSEAEGAKEQAEDKQPEVDLKKIEPIEGETLKEILEDGEAFKPLDEEETTPPVAPPAETTKVEAPPPAPVVATPAKAKPGPKPKAK